MSGEPELRCEKTTWKKRQAYLLSNHVVRLLTLAGGGHIAEFRFEDSSRFPSLSPLWVPPWKTMEPYRYRTRRHARQYGPLRDGKLLCGIAGHNLCLDYYGPPSAEEAAQGLSFHGEAPNLRWRKENLRLGSRRVALTLGVTLPIAGLEFSREIGLARGESVAYFKETVTNLRKADHLFNWVEHVTLGPPFLSRHHCRVAIPATKGITDPQSYDEGKTLLKPGCEFRWPRAPAASKAGGIVDLSRPLPQKGLGFVAGLLLDRKRELGFIAAQNTRHDLILGYCFARRDFPWVVVWDENRAIAAPPWNRETEARGLEFGSTPIGFARREAYTLGPVFGTPTLAHIPARGRKTVHYVAFLARTPRHFGVVEDVELGSSQIIIRGGHRGAVIRLRASGLRRDGPGA